MAYFKIGDVDFSLYVNSLKVSKTANYSAQTNAAGDTVVIPLNEVDMLKLQVALAAFSVSISFLNPQTNELETNVSCIIPDSEIEFYTIQVNKTMYKAATLTFIEL